MQLLHQLRASFMEASRTRTRNRHRARLLRRWEKDPNRPWNFTSDNYSPEDRELLVEFLCDKSLLGGASHDFLAHFLYRYDLSERSLHLIFDQTNILQSAQLKDVFLSNPNVPRLVWVEQIRTWYLNDYSGRRSGSYHFLPDETRDLLRILHRFCAWDDHEAFLALWDEITLMSDENEEKQIFLALLEGFDSFTGETDIPQLLAEFRAVAALV